MTITSHHRAQAALIALAVALLPGCGSFSKSSSKSSEIVSSPIASFSRSSSPEAAYREDVRDFTAAHVQSGGTVEGLRREVGSLAAKHGITDWERSESTYRALGAGLAQAGYRQVQVDAFKKNLADTEEQAEWIQKGYDSSR